jgi:hypothetical protein
MESLIWRGFGEIIGANIWDWFLKHLLCKPFSRTAQKRSFVNGGKLANHAAWEWFIDVFEPFVPHNWKRGGEESWPEQTQ